MKLMKTATAVLAAAALVGVNVAPAVMAWGDNSATGHRTTYTLENCTSDYSSCTITPSLGDKITFNSIINNPEIGGDERNFVGARENTGVNSGKGNTWNADTITVEDGKEYLIRIYAHNNNTKGTDGVAKDVTLHFTLPTTAGTELSVQGSIDSSNADPTRVYDDVVFKSADGSAFYLDYIEGSALYENNGVGANGGIQLSDSIITSNGVKIGYDALDGNIPGCFQYDSYTTIRVKAHYVNNAYEVQKTVRNVTNKEKTFSDTTEAKVGDIVEYQIYFKNTNDETLENVVVRDLLPNNMEYIEGTTKLYNSNHTSGATFQDETITTTGVNIGSYAADSNAYIRFRAKVVDNSMVCGTNKLVNWGQIGVGTNTIQDNAFVMVTKTEGCTNSVDPEKEETTTTTVSTVSELPKTGTGSIVAGVLGAGSVVTAADYYIASRKSLR